MWSLRVCTWISTVLNDIASNIQSEILLFPDEILLYRPINTPSDHDISQEDLIKWSNDWKMKFNISKCNAMHASNYKKNVSPLSFKFPNFSSS